MTDFFHMNNVTSIEGAPQFSSTMAHLSHSLRAHGFWKENNHQVVHVLQDVLLYFKVVRIAPYEVRHSIKRQSSAKFVPKGVHLHLHIV